MSDVRVGETIDAEPPCPTCGQQLVGEHGYVAWCQACHWNVAPAGAGPHKVTALDRFVQDSQESIDRAHERALRVGLDLAPRGWRGWAALLLAIPVHASGLALAAAGITLIATQWFSVYTLVVGTILIGFAVVLSTTATKSTKARALTPAESAELGAIFDELRESLGAPRIRRFRLDRAFNASVSRSWFGNEVTIGYPLWCATNDEERLGIFAHEVAHLVNGDVLRNRPVGLAIRMLANWQDVGEHMRARRGGRRGGQVIIDLVGWILSTTTQWYRALIVKLLLSQSQRAEYRADLLAASAVGTAVVVDGLESAQRALLVVNTMRRAEERGINPWHAIRDKVAGLPEAELRRLSLRARMDTAPTPGGSSHPPDGHRIAVLEAHTIAVELRIEPARWRTAEKQMAKATQDILRAKRRKRF
jgi:Zn-dependent protease with chaperone function